MKNVVILSILAIVTLSTVACANAGLVEDLQYQAERRRHIRSMHILERPYRTGHFYGNTVRRRHHAGVSYLYGSR